MARKKDKKLRNRPTPNRNQDKRRESKRRGGPDPGQEAQASQGTMSDLRRNLRRATPAEERTSPLRLMLYAFAAMLAMMLVFALLR